MNIEQEFYNTQTNMHPTPKYHKIRLYGIEMEEYLMENYDIKRKKEE